MERLTDLDELTTRCRTPSAREHIAEAIASYRGGAYRAAIVMSWIAVVFDLVEKVRELSLAGEPAASALLQTFEAYQKQIHAGNLAAMKQALEFERDLLTKVRTDLQLIDSLQLSDLERLREDRHRCAHPSFNQMGEAFRPPAELARLHLLNAIMHVLSQPPIQGKAALVRLRALVASEYFPLEGAKALTQLQSSSLAHATSALVRSFVDAMIFGYLDAASELHGLPQAHVALSAVLDMHRGLAEPRAAEQTCRVVRTASDAQFPEVVAFIASWPTGWSYLGAAEREKIEHFVSASDYAELEASVPGLATIAALEGALKERFLPLSTTQLETLLGEPEIAHLVIDAAIQKYVSATSNALARARRRRLLTPLLDQLTEAQVIAIIKGAGANAQVHEETHFPVFLKRLAAIEPMHAKVFRAAVKKAGLVELLSEPEDEI